MANRSLGTLTLDLVARIGGWQSGLDQAARVADSRSKAIERSFSALGGALRSIFGGLTIGFAIHKIVEETSKAQRVMSQLQAVVDKVGQKAGVTVPQLHAMAREFQDLTSFSDETAGSVEAILLQLGRINSNQLRQATKAVLDFATFKQADPEKVALAFGRALADPVKKMSSLARVGLVVTDQLKNSVKEAQRLGGLSGARTKLLELITERVPDAAAAYRNTLGGAIDALKHKFDDLFEFNATETKPLTDAINAVARNLEDLVGVILRFGKVYLIFKGLLLAKDIGGAVVNFVRMTAAIAAGTVVFEDQVTILQANTVEKYANAQASLAMAAADARAAGAAVAASRSYAASAEFQALNVAAQNAALAKGVRNEAKLAQANAALVGAQTAVIATTKEARTAQVALAFSSTRLGGVITKLLGPFRGLVTFIAGLSPIGRLAILIGSAATALYAFADDIKVTKGEAITLSDVFEATFDIISDAVKKASSAVTDYFGRAMDLLKFKLGTIEGAPKLWEDFKNAVLSNLPGMNLLLALLQKMQPLFDKIMAKAKLIAAEREKLEKGVPGALPGEEDEEGAGDTGKEAANALERIKDMVSALREKNEELENGAIAALKLSLAEGDLKKLFDKAGPAANQYREVLVRLTEENERLKRATEQSKEAIKAQEELVKFAEELEKQVALYGKGERAVFDYALAHDELAAKLKKAGESAESFKARIIAARDALDTKEMATKLRELRIELLELMGEEPTAIRLRFELDHKELRRQLREAGDIIGLEMLNRLEEVTLAQARFNELRERAGEINAELARQEERIRNSQETGAICAFNAMQQLEDQRKTALEQLKAINDEMAQLVALHGTPELREAFKDMTANLEELERQTHLTADHIGKEIGEAFEGPFADFIEGTKKAGEAWDDFVNNLRRKFAELVAEQLTQQFVNGLIRGISALVGMFGSSSLPGVGAYSPGAGGVGPYLPPRRAYGGPVYAGELYRVQENEPEFFRPKVNGDVIPLSKMRMSSVTNHFSFMINAPNGSVSRQTQLQLAASAARGAAQAQRRNG